MLLCSKKEKVQSIKINAREFYVARCLKMDTQLHCPVTLPANKYSMVLFVFMSVGSRLIWTHLGRKVRLTVPVVTLVFFVALTEIFRAK